MMSSNFFIIFICMFLLALHLSWGYKPVIEAFPSNIVRKRDSVTIRCSSQYQGILRLNIKRDSSFVDAKTEEQEYNFFVPNVEKDTDCTCIQVYNNIWSDYSDVLTLKVIEEKGSSDYDFLIPIVATVCVILILILAVILGIYFKRKNKPSPQKMKNSEYPQGEHAKANTEATYSTIDETKLRPPPDVEENIEDTTVDDDNDGITYARLNSANLKPKNTQSYTPADTGLYAEVKKSKPM
ncbi:uncharacterized protein LOC130293846 isoform X3 [Hyla sarda]|uniref:uncharacterized protein LOC130293846 isoform X3 n=1 Tax=Hyla sarda TaxID=327740 RepID=UPI0024C2E935|nr:uncharacterized protein LOC130293846 isoform X3 [Hyla sarda]